jgi:hypothetical protein
MSDRRITTAVTMTALVGLLVAGLVVGTRWLFAPMADDAELSPGATCTPAAVEAGKRLRTRDVTVSVFNAGERSGLASQTLDQLGNRGFKLGDTGNAPEDTRVRFVQVWSTEKDDPAARLVALQFGKNTAVRRGEDLGPGIDVIVGNRFKGLVAGAPRSVRVRQPAEVCASANRG